MLSEEAKQVLRERLKIAREAKEAKKSKVKEATKEVVVPTVPKPTPAPAPTPPAPELVLPPPVVDATAPRDAPITTKVTKSAKKS